MDGQFGALLPGGKYFITTPYKLYVPLIRLEASPLQLREDWRFGPDDCTCWPQPWSDPTCYHSVIMQRPDDQYDPAAKWWEPLDHFHFEDDGSMPGKSVGIIREAHLARYESDYATIMTRTEDYKRVTPRINAAVASLSLSLTTTLSRLYKHSMTFRQAAISMAQFQREYLELMAALDWVQIFKPRLTGMTPTYTHDVWTGPPKRVMGTILYGDFVPRAEALFSIGIPYWILRNVSCLTTVRVDSAVEMLAPESRVVTKMAPFSVPLGTYFAGDTAKYDKITSFFSNRLSCTNPFAHEYKVHVITESHSASASAPASPPATPNEPSLDKAQDRARHREQRRPQQCTY